MTNDAIPFVPPTTYAEVQVMVGRTYQLPSGEVAPVRGCGMSGSDLHVLFGEHNAPVAFWSTLHGLETPAEHKLRLWDTSAARLNKSQRKLVTIVLGDVFSDPNRAGVKDPALLPNVAMVRLHRAGLLEYENCGRCGGSGHYSYNSMSGSRCFGCSGKKYVFPSVGKALKVAVRCDEVRPAKVG